MPEEGEQEEISSGDPGLCMDEESSFMKTLSRCLVSGLGESNIFVLAAVFLVFGVTLVLLAFRQESSRDLFFGFLVLAVSGVLFSADDYYGDRKCRKCGRPFAYVQVGEPDIVESGSKVLKTCYYRCKYCAHERVEVKKERIRKRLS